MDYETTGNKLIERIRALLPSHPEILQMDSPFDLFGIPEFDCKDLQPSLAQACAALSVVKRDYQRNQS